MIGWVVTITIVRFNKQGTQEEPHTEMDTRCSRQMDASGPEPSTSDAAPSQMVARQMAVPVPVLPPRLVAVVSDTSLPGHPTTELDALLSPENENVFVLDTGGFQRALPPYTREPDEGEASSGIQTGQFGNNLEALASTGGHRRQLSGGMFSRAEQAARMGIEDFSSADRKAKRETQTMPSPTLFDAKVGSGPARAATASPSSPNLRGNNGSPVLGRKRDLKGGELLGTLKLEGGSARALASWTDLSDKRSKSN